MEIASRQVDKQELINQIKKTTKGEIDSFLKHIITEKLNHEKDPQKLYEFFTYIYDNLYHDILFKKIIISKQIMRALETLAMPACDITTINKLLKKL